MRGKKSDRYISGSKLDLILDLVPLLFLVSVWCVLAFKMYVVLGLDIDLER